MIIFIFKVLILCQGSRFSCTSSAISLLKFAPYIELIPCDPWNIPFKAIVLPHIGTTWDKWDLRWSAHETAPVHKAIFCYAFVLLCQGFEM